MTHDDHSPIPLLLISGGSLVGQNVVQAIADRRRHVRLTATNSVADEPSLQDFDEVRLVPPTFQDEAGLERVVIDWMAAEPPALVLPCRDDDIVFLARLAARRPELAPSLLVGAPGPAEAMSDKWRSWHLSREWHLPFAPTMLPDSPEAVEDFVKTWGFPLLVKPRAGFASTRVSILRQRAQLDRVIGAEDMVVQKYLGDPRELDAYLDGVRDAGLPLFHSFEAIKHSIQAMIGPDGALAGVFTTLHRMRNGVSVAVEEDRGEDARKLGARCAEVFAGLGWRGPLNIQCQRTPQGDLAIYEFNGRFTGATAARALLGYDEVGLALRLFAQRALPLPSDIPASRVLRQPASRAVPAALRDALLGGGVWRRDPEPASSATL